jgi:hypothetical protein
LNFLHPSKDQALDKSAIKSVASARFPMKEVCCDRRCVVFPQSHSHLRISGGSEITINNTKRYQQGHSRQIQALGMKMISYQKRQTCTNIFCIGLCPLFMVAIAGILGNLISGLIIKANPINEFIYCSSQPGNAS